MTAREVVQVLERDGWIEKKGTGSSHRQFVHPTKPGKVTVPFHRGDIGKGLLNSILKQAGLK